MCRARIQELGFKPEKVAELVSRTFNEMVFIHGDVHCDPHAANLFLRKNPANGQMQLVLLDHGLYRYAMSCHCYGNTVAGSWPVQLRHVLSLLW